MHTKKNWKPVLFILSLIALSVWIAYLTYPQPKLRVIACDVGQGDAILAVYGKTQILFDGGPNNKVLDCLSKYMPFWDREIEVVVLTHPQKDHFMGLIEVFKRYNVDLFLANSIDFGSKEYGALKKAVGGSGVRVINPISGMTLGNSMIYLDIVFPTREFLVSNTKEKMSNNYINRSDSDVLGVSIISRDPNDFSVIAILRYGDFDALFTGDMGPAAIGDVLATGKVNDIDYLKVPHHGSKNGLTRDLLDASKPEIAVISVGKNQWGHPHKVVLDMLKNTHVKVFRTDKMGDVEVDSDGRKWWLEK